MRSEKAENDDTDEERPDAKAEKTEADGDGGLAMVNLYFLWFADIEMYWERSFVERCWEIRW